MAVNEDDQNFKLKLQANQMAFAIESTGSQAIAKQILGNNAKDAFFVKMKFRIGNKIGIAFPMISSYTNKVLVVYALAGNNESIEKARPLEGFMHFIQVFSDAMGQPGLDNALGSQIGRAIYYALSTEVLEKQLPLLEKNNTKEFLTLIIAKLSEQANTKDIVCEADVEKVSSVQIRTNHHLEEKLKPIHPPTDMASPQESSSAISQPIEFQSAKDYLKAVEGKYPAIVRVKTIVSPRFGVDVTDLAKDEIIFFKALVSTPEHKVKANANKLLAKDGTPIEVEGKLLDLIKTPEGEYHIFALGPNGILLHSVDSQKLKIQVLNIRELSSEQVSPSSGRISPTGKESSFDLVTVLIWVAIALFLGLVFAMIV